MTKLDQSGARPGRGLVIQSSNCFALVDALRVARRR
jgi:hypothetical protein